MRARLIAAAAVALPLVTGTAAWVWWRAGEQAVVERGHRLFDGRADLAGRIPGHTMVLPPAAARCVNCHETRSTALSAAASAVASPAPTVPGAQAGRYAPALDRAALTESRLRRGGPASRYDAAALCALLRTGVDPAQVMIPQAMPRYEIDAADCQALWRYLLTR